MLIPYTTCCSHWRDSFGTGLGFRAIAEDHRILFRCSSSERMQKPKVEHQRSRFWSSRSDVGHRRWPGFRGHGATHRVSLNFVIKSFRSHHGYSSYATRITLACYRLGQGGDSDVVIVECHVAAMWDRLLVTAWADCSSAIHPKVQHRPMFLPAIPFPVEPIGFWASTVIRLQEARATHKVSLNLGTFPSVSSPHGRRFHQSVHPRSQGHPEHRPDLQLCSGIFCRGSAVDCRSRNLGVGVFRWFVCRLGE